MSVQQAVEQVRARIAAAARLAGRDPAEVTLVAATKTQSDQTIREAVAAGITVCGENRVQEFTAHQAGGAYEGAAVHFIGHLQTNKVKYVVGQVELIESVSSDKLLEAVAAQAAKLGIRQDVLLEVNIGREESKSGYLPEQVLDAARFAASLSPIRLRGLMAIPPAARVPGENRPFFAQMNQLFVDIRTELRNNETDITALSMGMSGDYPDAVAEGATLVRVGSALFGPRPAPGR